MFYLNGFTKVLSVIFIVPMYALILDYVYLQHIVLILTLLSQEMFSRHYSYFLFLFLLFDDVTMHSDNL